MLTVINPATGAVLHELGCMTQADIEQHLQQAQAAQIEWRQKSFSERGQILKAVAKQLRANVEQHALMMTDEMGKPVKEAYGEVEKAAWCAEHYADHAEDYLKAIELPSDATKSYVQHLPLGVVLGILPWNAPFWLAFRFAAPALMAGNTCVMKPDPHVPGCGELIEKAFIDAGAPKHIFTNMPVENKDAESLIRHPIIKAVSFTGSSNAGSTVASIAASELKPFVLELGGSDPAIVLSDADLDEAVPTIALSRIINAGQSCIAAKRIIVEANIYEDFINKFKNELDKYPVGDPRDESKRVGPIARQDLLDNLDRQVQESISAGARCMMGGKPLEDKGFFYPVTLLVDVTEDMAVAKEETFGPVAVIMKADNAEQAIEIANNTEYGLGAAIWTDAKAAEKMAPRIESGQVAINGIVKTDPRLPSGGIKRSGIGRELGPHGIHEFVNTQQIWIGPKID